MSDDNQKLMELQIEKVNQDEDRDENNDKINLSENRMFTICIMPGTTMEDEDQDQNQVMDEGIDKIDLKLSENRMFTICIMPGTTMHIKISNDKRFPEDTWSISTLLIHNGQHYANTVKFAMNSEVLRTLGLIHNPNDVTSNMLPQLLIPMDVPRSPIRGLIRFLHYVNKAKINPYSWYSNLYCKHMPQSYLTMKSIFQSILDEPNTTPEMLEAAREGQESYDEMLRNFETRADGFNGSPHCSESDDEDLDFNNDQRHHHHLCNANIFADLRANFHDNNNDDTINYDDDSTLSESELQVILARNRDAIDRVNRDDSDGDTLSSEFTVGIDDQSTNRDDTNRILDESWSGTSSESANDRHNDDTTDTGWDSELFDHEDYETYMLRHLRTHSLQTEFTNHLTGPPIRLRDTDWDANSVDSAVDNVDDWSDTGSIFGGDPNAWQYHEDRSFETELSRPLVRLIGERPRLTAQDDRQCDQFFRRLAGLFDPESVQCPFHNAEPQSEPLYSLGRWRPRENLNTSSHNDSSFSANNSLYSTHLDENGFNDSDMSSFSDAYISQYFCPVPDPASEFALDSIINQMEIDNTANVQQVVPLAAYIQQTEELIAQIWASFE